MKSIDPIQNIENGMGIPTNEIVTNEYFPFDKHGLNSVEQFRANDRYSAILAARILTADIFNVLCTAKSPENGGIE